MSKISPQKLAKERAIAKIREAAGNPNFPDPREAARDYANSQTKDAFRQNNIYYYWLEGACGAPIYVYGPYADEMRKGASWSKKNPGIFRPIQVTIKTASGKKTKYKFICAHAAIETAARLEKLPQKFFR